MWRSRRGSQETITGAEAFPEESNFDPTVNKDWYTSGVNALNFTVEKPELNTDTVGIQAMPMENTAKEHVGFGDDGKTDETDDEPDPTIPSGYVAYDDTNGNEVYDEGETRYTEEELIGTFNDKNVDLVIERDVISNSNKIDLKSNNLLVKAGVTMATSSGRNINFDIEGPIDVSGSTLTAEGGNADMSLKADGDFDARNTVLNFGKSAEAEADGGELIVNDNGGNKEDGGTYIEKNDGNPGTLNLKKGSLNGTPEYGDVTDS